MEIKYRTWEKGDAKGFRSCIESFYKDGYPYKEFLDGRVLSGLSKTGQIIIVVGTDPDGRIVSTSAALFKVDFPGSGILMLRVVRPEFRGQGIGLAHENYLMERINEKADLYSLYADVMTHDTVSQKSLNSKNYSLTGLRLNLYFNSIMVPELKFSKGSKMSQAVMCIKKNAPDKVRIVSIPEHDEIIKKIYTSLGVEVETLPIGECGIEQKTVKRNSLHHSMVSIIQKCSSSTGVDDDVKPGKNETAVVYLNLCDSGCLPTYQRLKEMGFKFTGLKPLNTCGEFLILSNPGTSPLNFNEIAIIPEGKFLLDYIKKEFGYEAN